MREIEAVDPAAIPQRTLYTGAQMPAIGLGTFLAQMFLRRPLMAAGTREFSVQGSWDDPKIERVERKPGEPVPDIDAVPAAPAAASAPKGAS